MKKKELENNLRKNRRKITEYKKLLARLDVPEDREKCQLTIIKLYELEASLKKQAERDKADRIARALKIAGTTVAITLLIVGFMMALLIGGDNESKRLDSIREQHFIEYPEARQ